MMRPVPPILSRSSSTPLILDAGPLAAHELEEVARRHRPVALGPHARQRLEAAQQTVRMKVAGGDAVYGVNTGFGSLSRVRIGDEAISEVQRNLIRSHAAGVGDPLPIETVRAMMVALAASLCRGRSGVNPRTVEAILSLLNNAITPVVPSRGSVGASGDLAPLAHVALALMGEGFVWFNGVKAPSRYALLATSLNWVEPGPKEGLALINGTHFMSSLGALALLDADRVVNAAIAAAAMAIDACRGTDVALDDRLHEARRQPGQRRVAELMRTMLKDSAIVASHRRDDPRVQDPYGLRCAPQVIGAALDALTYCREVINRELGAVTDNPLVFPESGDILSGGNFHGAPLAIALDVARIAITHVAGIAERRVYWILAAVDPQNPINAYLSPQPGLHSGLMIAQYTAAACCNEMQTLAHPASVHNIPTSAGIEDYNSMGATSALLLDQSIKLAARVIAIELLVMAEAIEYHRPLKSGAPVEAVHAAIRAVVPKLDKDRPPSPDIEALAHLVLSGTLLGGAELVATSSSFP
jgi:histidine ammonia-lyase